MASLRFGHKHQCRNIANEKLTANKPNYKLRVIDNLTSSIKYKHLLSMNITDTYILNFEEIRRRSIMIWKGLPKEFNHWKPDKDAESFIEVIRHVLECEQLFHMRILKRGILTDYISPWTNKPIISLEDELTFAVPYRNEFLNMVRSFSAKDLDTIEIIGKAKTQTRKLGDYLLRAAYHESVHAGQFLANLRAAGIDRSYIWD